MYHILSVDWDFFFPNMEGFDWGANLSLSPVIQDYLWVLRYYNQNLSTKEYAKNIKINKDYFDNFWNFVCKDYGYVVAFENHAMLYQMVVELGVECCIDNFDQHHDYGYGKSEDDEPQAGDWAIKLSKFGLLKKYHLYYPEWRRFHPEGNINKINKLIKIDYGLPYKPKKYDIVFFARSPEWTPPWLDHYYIDLIGGKTANVKPRDFDKKAAKDYRKEWMSHVSKLRNRQLP